MNSYCEICLEVKRNIFKCNECSGCCCFECLKEHFILENATILPCIFSSIFSKSCKKIIDFNTIENLFI